MIQREYRNIKNLNGKQKRRFASCYLVEDIKTNEQFVLKIAQENNLLHLQKEAQFSFSNPSLPKVIDFKINETQAELFLKFKEGTPILTYYKSLKRKVRITFLIQLIEEITQILLELNENKIVHLDIKPSNILYAPLQNRFHLIDFGLAENLPAPARKTLFPLGYAAPELILSHHDCFSLGSDLFALGATIYHLYTNEVPLTHSNPSIFTNLQLAHPIQRPNGMPKSLFNILQGFMIKPNWKTSPNRMQSQDVNLLLKESIKKREESLHSLSKNLEQLKKYDNSNLFVKLFSKSNI